MLTYSDCCDDIFYPRALCQIHLQTQPKSRKGNKVFTSPIISANMATSNVSAADLRSKKSFTSPIWQYFGFKTDEDDNVKPTCKLCLKKVSAAGGNTSNLQRHFRDHHPANAQELGKQA